MHLSSSDCGGAGRACVRLHKSLLNYGIDSIILTQNKTSDFPQIHRLAQTKFQKAIEKIRPSLSQLPLSLYSARHSDIFSPQLPFFIPSNKLLLRRIDELKPDIVHLHWVESGFINIKDLAKINAPLLWNLHDANPYTGGCHIVAAACIGVGIGCKKCPLLCSKNPYDISYFSFRRKKNAYNKLNITINGLSRWIAKCAKDSALFKDKTIINLPNPIDTNAFAPIPKKIARKLLNITTAQKVIAFGAIDDIHRKGFSELLSALKLLKIDYHLIVFGANSNASLPNKKTHFLGKLSDDATIRLAYNSCDVFVVPSLAENLSNAIMEALSCAVPVVAFDIGGNGDMITHKHNGYLAKDVSDLARGIEWVLDSANYQILSQNARNSVMENFSETKVAKQYILQYETIIAKNANRGGGRKV